MKKSTKKIAVLGLALATTVCLFTACEQAEKTYSIKVTLPDGTAAFGTQVALTGGKEAYVGTVNADGYAIIQAPEFTYGLSFENTIRWIIAGLPWDFIHAGGNLVAGLLIVPTVKILRKLEASSHRQ